MREVRRRNKLSMRPDLSLALLACLPLPGCYLSKDGWLKLAPPAAELGVDHVENEARLLHARGDFLLPEGGERLELHFVTAPGSVLDGAGYREPEAVEQRLVLRPPPRGSWLRKPGAEIFKPESFALSMSRAPWFHTRGPSATLAFRGSLPVAACGTITPAAQAPTHWRGLAALDKDSRRRLAPLLRAAERHDWQGLLTGEQVWREARPLPLGVYDATGTVLAPAMVAAAVAAAHVDQIGRAHV